MSTQALKKSSSFTRLSLATAALLGVLSTSVHAETMLSGYVGMAGGFNPSQRECNGAEKISCDRLAFGSKLFGGWNMTPNVAIEINYFYFGGIDTHYSQQQNASVAKVRENGRALTLGFNWNFELLHHLTNNLRFGLANSQTNKNWTSQSDVRTSTRTYSVVPYIGAGLSMPLNEHLSFTSGYDYIIDGHNSRHLFSLGVTSQFGNNESVGHATSYVGGALGIGHVSADCDDAPSCDKTDAAGKLYVGTNFSSNVAGEIGYIRMKGFNASGPGASLDIKGDAFILAGAFRMPVSAGLTGVARVGVANVRTVAEATLGSVSGKVKTYSVQPYLGLGGEYAVSKAFKITSALDFTKAKTVDHQTFNARLLTVGAQADF